MAARIVSRGQNRGFAAARKSAMSLALAYQRALASANAAASPDFAARRISTAIVMCSCTTAAVSYLGEVTNRVAEP